MPVTVRSFAKINLGLCIGALRPDGFHDLHTMYQTIALHDIIRVRVTCGTGIEIRCRNPQVPTGESNTCYRIAERVMRALDTTGKVVIEIEKRLPVQGGLGGASGNAVSCLLALEWALKKSLPHSEKLRIAAEVGSDLPLFLVGGAVLGVGRGEQVYPLPDLPPAFCVVATPKIGVSTPKAFADWEMMLSGAGGRPGAAKLTACSPSDRMLKFSRAVSAWLTASFQPIVKAGRSLSGVPAGKDRGRAETLLLDLVRTGIENDFERVVFPQYPAIRDVKRVLEGAGALYASLSGSGSAVYGLFGSRPGAEKAVARLRRQGIEAQVAATLTRQQYWRKFLVSSF